MNFPEPKKEMPERMALLLVSFIIVCLLATGVLLSIQYYRFDLPLAVAFPTAVLSLLAVVFIVQLGEYKLSNILAFTLMGVGTSLLLYSVELYKRWPNYDTIVILLAGYVLVVTMVAAVWNPRLLTWLFGIPYALFSGGVVYLLVPLSEALLISLNVQSERLDPVDRVSIALFIVFIISFDLRLVLIRPRYFDDIFDSALLLGFNHLNVVKHIKSIKSQVLSQYRVVTFVVELSSPEIKIWRRRGRDTEVNVDETGAVTGMIFAFPQHEDIALTMPASVKEVVLTMVKKGWTLTSYSKTTSASSNGKSVFLMTWVNIAAPREQEITPFQWRAIPGQPIEVQSLEEEAIDL